MKLQQAYISESVAIGDWGVIGYKGPGDEDVKSVLTGGGKSHTTNFEYTESQTFTNNTVALGSSDIIGWNAKKFALQSLSATLFSARHPILDDNFSNSTVASSITPVPE